MRLPEAKIHSSSNLAPQPAPDKDLAPAISQSLPYIGALMGLIDAIKRAKGNGKRTFILALPETVVGFGLGTFLASLGVDPNTLQRESEGGGNENNPNFSKFPTPEKPADKAIQVKQEAELVKKRARFDELLNNPKILEEFKQTEDNILHIKLREGHDRPPFKEIKEYNPAFYNPKGELIIGKWDDMHIELAKQNNLLSEYQNGNLVDGTIITFAQEPDVHVFLTTFSNFSTMPIKTIEDLQNQGYVVMGADFRWWVVDYSSSSPEIKELPSGFEATRGSYWFDR